MELSAALPEPGQIARVRQRLYLVELATPGTTAADSTLVGLSCVDDDAQGQPLEVLWEREVDTEILSGEAWDSIAKRGFDQAKVFSSYLNTLRWNCVTSTDPRLFQSPFRAGIKLDAYQLEPLRKALLLPRVNLFIADDVGLGKTIEAGLIARELLLRKKAREIIVCCPPSMLLQWQEELENRFGLTFEILDKDYLKRIRRERGFGVNPWSTHSRFLVSHRLLIDEAYTNPLIDWLGDFRSGSLLILDEAHHAAPVSGQKYAIDSQFTRAIRDVAPRFEHRLFLSATPHNGHSNSFSALLELLDPQRFCRGVPATQKLLDAVMVRRLKDDLRTIQGGFPERKIKQVDIDGLSADAPELQLFALLDEYRNLREERLSAETKRKQAAAGLLITGLQQRLLSSVEAFARTLRVHRKTVQRQWEEFQSKQTDSSATPVLGPIDLLNSPVGNDDDRATLSDEELQAEEDAQVAAVTEATGGPLADKQSQTLFAREQQLLDQMTEAAETARGRPDARVRAVVDWIRKHMCPDLPVAGTAAKSPAQWNGTRILIFTEYEDTKRYLHQQLSAAIQATDRADDRIALFAGSTPARSRESSTVPSREDIKQAFNADPAKHPLRILIATDAAREGLNLQAHCWNLFHFDVPWNPSRLEQRNGRIDRKLQPHPEVFCHYFVYKQRPEDRILQALVRKTETIKKELGSLAQVIDGRLADTLKLGIRRDRIDAMESEIESADLDSERRQAVEGELEASRERQDALRSQFDKLRSLLDESQQTIGLSKDHFRSAISCALELIGAKSLVATRSADSVGPERSEFPALDQREGADSTWADTMDTLRAPKPRDQKYWEWRRTSPIRPVVFEDTGAMNDEVVHLHLEHRVVQRLLGRFVAQGFVHHDLSRACFAQTTDAIPRVVLLGRLCLYGPGAARLHEELIPVTARWTDAAIRKGPLAPYARDAESKTLTLLEEALLDATGRPVSEVTLKQLQAVAPRDVQELLPHLTTRGEEYARDAEKKLQDRAEAEAKAMRVILETQQKHITDTIAKHDKVDARQRQFDFQEEDERRQLESNRRYWDKRLTMLEQELQTEPERIRDVYQVKAKRIEPVGLVYLWPVTG
jgi:SNF2 family DNA or RNA helicase